MKKDWEIRKLGNACELINRGISPKYTEISGICVLNQKCIRNHEIQYDLARLHDDKLKTISHEKLIQEGDVLINSTGTGTLGRIAQVRKCLKQPVTVDSHITIVRPIKDLFYSDFFGYALTLIEDDISKMGEGCGGQTELSRSALNNNFLISFPKLLTEQQRIVTILDEAFNVIAKAKANAEQNLKNARELFDSYLESAFLRKNNNWEEMSLGNLISVLTDYHSNGSYETLKKNVELKSVEDYAWMVRSTDFENNFSNDFRYIDQNGYEYLKKSKVFGGEIIMSKIGNAGNVYLMPKLNRPCSLAMNLFLIRLDETKANPEYTYFFLKSRQGEVQIKSRLLGMATKTITKENVKSISIPLPPLEEQIETVHNINNLLIKIQKLEAIYIKKTANLDELKRSILQKAFNGELKTAELEIA